tara:strand:- start:94 stop:405 length:312 start_codon:yes stop_codon:yes gene_type:complete
MAISKVKSTSEKIKQLTGKKPSKINKEELQSIQEIINRINRGQLDIGILETRKHGILHEITLDQQRLQKMQVEFEKEYGTSDINIQDGTINYLKENGKVNKKD